MKLLKTRSDMPNDIPDNDIPAVETHYEAAKKNILIVDDSGFARKILKDMLESEGHNVVGEAADGFEALEMAKQTRPDFIFLDVAMPKLDGMGALPQILEANSNLKIIMCTAMGQKSIIVEAMKIGAIDYVLKPYKKENIVEVLNAHLESKNSQVISFEEEKKHYIKERTRDTIVREVAKDTEEIKENAVKKEATEVAENNKAANEVTNSDEAANKEKSPDVKTEESLKTDIEEAVTKADTEAPSLELLDGGESLELAVEEESLEASAETDSLDIIAEEEGSDTIAEEAVLDVAAEEGTLEIASEGEGNEAVAEEENLPAVDVEEEALNTIVKEETLDTDSDVENRETDTKKEAVEAASDKEVRPAGAKEEPAGIVAGQEATEIVAEEIILESVSAKEAEEPAAKGEMAGSISVQEVRSTDVKEETAGSIPGQEILQGIAKEENTESAGNQEETGAVAKDEAREVVPVKEAEELAAKGEAAGSISVQEVPDAGVKEETIENVSANVSGREILQGIAKEEAVSAVSAQEIREAGTGGEIPEKINAVAEIRRTEEDTESSAFSYLWIDRFDSRHEEGSAHRIARNDNYVQNFCGFSHDGNNLSEEENSEQNILFDMINAYMNLNNRFENENVVGKYLFRPYEGIRLPTFKVFGSEWYGKDEITISNILRVSNYSSSQGRVYFEKNSLYHMIMHLVQEKAERILGQDRMKI